MSTASERLGMFPLGTVLLPGEALPLSVFEPRYRRLVEDCVGAVPEFGVVLIERGREVGGGDVRTSVGTRARIVQLAELGGGRYALVAVGIERIQVATWLPDDPYPQGLVTGVPDEVEPMIGEASWGELVERVTTRVRRVQALSVELGDARPFPFPDLDGDPTQASFVLAGASPLGPRDRQRLLEAPGPRARLLALETALDDVEAALRFRLLGEASPSDEPPAW